MGKMFWWNLSTKGSTSVFAKPPKYLRLKRTRTNRIMFKQVTKLTRVTKVPKVLAFQPKLVPESYVS